MIYEDETPAVYFEMLAADGVSLLYSLVFSFPITDEPTHRLDLRVRLLGFAADRDRTINVGSMPERPRPWPGPITTCPNR